MSNKRQTPSMPDDLRSLFGQSAPLEPDEVELLRRAASGLDDDPGFRADYLKGLFLERVHEAMRESGLSQSKLARRWGKSRQYVSKVFKEDGRVNFTIESMSKLASLVGCKLDILVLRPGEQASVRSCHQPDAASRMADNQKTGSTSKPSRKATATAN